MVFNMICIFGMSEKLGNVTLKKREEEVFLGRDIFTQEKMYSEKTAQIIDEEMKRILDEAYYKATELIRNNIDKLNRLAENLVEKEILEGEDLVKLLNGESLSAETPKA